MGNPRVKDQISAMVRINDLRSTTRFVLKWTTGIGKLNSIANYVCLRYSLVPIWKYRVETTSGYIQRKIVKLSEDLKIQYDGTVRDTLGSIYQVAYGEDGINPTTTVKVGKDQEVCDISSIVNKLNIKHEDEIANKRDVEEELANNMTNLSVKTTKKTTKRKTK